ncbi:MAG: hypothetical protein AB1498_06665 [bacterium]
MKNKKLDFKTAELRLELVYSRDDDTGDFEKDIKTYAVLSCSADGPNGSIYCREENVRTEEFINKNNVRGVKVYRKKMDIRYTETETINTTYDDVVVAYSIKVPGYVAIAFSVRDSSAKNIEMMVNLANTFKYLKLSQ